MTWKQALLQAIEKWDIICFSNGSAPVCALCRMTFGIHCGECPIRAVTHGCNGFGWEDTSNKVPTNAERGCDADIHFYMMLCMLYHEYYGEPMSEPLLSEDELKAIIQLHLPYPPYESFEDYEYRAKEAAKHITRELKERYEDE